MTDWVPVFLIALVVVCATAFLLLDQKFGVRTKDR